MTFTEWVNRKHPNGNYMMCESGRAFIAAHNYNLRSLLTVKAARECKLWDGPPAWCLLFWLADEENSLQREKVLTNVKENYITNRAEVTATIKSALRRQGITQWEPGRKR